MYIELLASNSIMKKQEKLNRVHRISIFFTFAKLNVRMQQVFKIDLLNHEF